MASLSNNAEYRFVKVHPIAVRIMHWVNAIAVIIMIGSGWRIYNNVPIFDWLHFPQWATLGGDPEITYKLNADTGFSNALLWHFAAMWLFFINGTVALIYGFASGRIGSRWFPISFKAIIHDLKEALNFRLAHEDPTIYNAVQRLSYVGVVFAAIMVFLSGLAIWKPVQFQTLTWLMYDFQGARLVHFLSMAAIVLFMVVHVSLAFLVPKTLVGMTLGKIAVKTPETPQVQPGE